MKRILTILLLAALTGCASAPLPPAPTVAEIVEMAKSGSSADAIIQRIEASRAVYQLSASRLARLREQGVPDKVIDYMQQAYIDAARYAEWVRARDAFFYPPFPPPPFRRYPYGW